MFSRLFASAATPTFGLGEAALQPALRGATLFMIGLLVFMLGGILVAGLILARRARRGESPEHALIRELQEAPPPAPPVLSPAPEPPSWERDPDWWKPGDRHE